MPIDIATGDVELAREDFALPGRVRLTWTRHFRSSLLKSQAPLAPGWTTSLFPSMVRVGKEWHFTTGEGDVHVFADPEEEIARGQTLRLLGAFLELVRSGNRLIVTQWDVDSGEIQRFVFAAERAAEGLKLSLVAIEDVSGAGLELTWNASGRLATIRQRIENRTVIVNYSAAGRIDSLALVTKGGVQTQLVGYEYDSSGRLSAAIDRRGLANRYEYDGQSRIKREILRDGAVYSYRYDDQGRCMHFSGLDHYNEKRLQFLDTARTTIVTNSQGRDAVYRYLPTGQIVDEVDAAGCHRETEFDEYDRIVAKSGPGGTTTRYTYDAQGNCDSVVDPLGNTYRFAFTALHQPALLTDPLGKTWRHEYDANHRLVATHNPLGARWTIDYDEVGNPIVMTDPLGSRRRQRFVDGLPQEMTDWMGHVTRFKWDDLGRVTERVGPVGERTAFRYDPAGNPVEVVLPDGGRLSATYDGGENLSSFSNAKGQTTRLRYGPCRRLLQRDSPGGGTVRYRWGTEPERLDAITNEKGQTCSYTRNEVGRIIGERSFDGREQSFEYDGSGQCVAFTNGNGERIQFKRDAIGRVLEQVLPDGSITSLAYNPVGRMVSAVNADIGLRFEYDDAGRLIQEAQGPEWVRTEYNLAGEVTRTHTSLGHEVVYELDPNGRVGRLSAGPDNVLMFDRDPRGLATSWQMPGGLRLEQRFNSMGRLSTQRVNSSTDFEVVSRDYQYDSDGLLGSIKDGRWGSTEYVYDPAERLLSALRVHGHSEYFEYDAADNLTRIKKEGRTSSDVRCIAGPGNRLGQCGDTRYEYDAAGRLVVKSEPGASDAARVWEYSWGAEGQLRKVRRPDGQEWEYQYDAFGRRVAKRGPTGTVRFLWNGDAIIQELPDQGEATAWIMNRGSLTASFVPIARVQRGEIHTIITDHLGTPREMVDRYGSVVWAATHDSWGKVNPVPATQVDCPIRFQGQWYDEETGLHYNRFRYYDPEIARFISADPIELLGGMNEYSYGPNPLNWVDPLGLTGKPGCPESSEGEPPQYFIEEGVRRSVAARERGSPTVPAIIHEPGKPPVQADIPLSQLNSPKPVLPRDQRMVAILMMPGPPPPISVSPMPGPVPTVPLADVKLVRARP